VIVTVTAFVTELVPISLYSKESFHHGNRMYHDFARIKAGIGRYHNDVLRPDSKDIAECRMK